jgi:hypothetical protein
VVEPFGSFVVYVKVIPVAYRGSVTGGTPPATTIGNVPSELMLTFTNAPELGGVFVSV